MKDIFIIFTGLIRHTDKLNKSLNDLIKLKDKYNIKKIFILTWKGQNYKNQILNNNLIKYIEYQNLKDLGGGNHLAQMFHYKKGLELVNNYKTENDKYILKTRTDVYINPDFYDTIFNYNYNINSNILTHKIWVPWVHKTKPFYFEDSLFFSHINSMEKLYNIDNIFKLKNIGQGITHIRRFITPFLNNIKYKEYCNNLLQNKDNLMIRSLKLNINEIKNIKNGKEFIDYYYEILNKYFYIKTDNNNSIIFRNWNKMNNNLNKQYNFDLLYKI